MTRRCCIFLLAMWVIPTLAQSPLTPIPCSAESSLKSVEGRTAAEIVFSNATSSPVTIYWLNYQGQRAGITVLGARERYVQATYLTHPWLIARGRECLAIFQPELTRGLAEIHEALDSSTVSPNAAVSVIGAARPGQLAIVAISGSGFAEGATARLTTPAGVSTLAGPALVRISDRQLFASVTLPALPNGPYSAALTIVNPNGDIAAFGTFTVGALPLAGAIAGPQSIITTIAGGSRGFTGDGQVAINTPLGSEVGIGLAVSRDGTAYIALSNYDLVVSVSRDGILRVVAGNGIRGYSGDGGPATSASLSYPTSLALDDQGALYIGEGFSVRKVTGGRIRTIAGNGKAPGTSAPIRGLRATSASISVGCGLAADRFGNLYLCESLPRGMIHKVDANGNINTVAGTGKAGYSGDGLPATSAEIEPYGIAVDNDGNLYVAAATRIRKVNSNDGQVSTMAGVGFGSLEKSGQPAVITAFSGARWVAVDDQGNVFSAQGNRLFRIGLDGILTILNPNNPFEGGFSGDGGPVRGAQFSFLSAGGFDGLGGLYLLDRNRVRKVVLRGDDLVSTIAGTGAFSAVPRTEQATATSFPPNQHMAVDGKGQVWIADRLNNRVRKLTPDGTLQTVAGSDRTDPPNDNGPAELANFSTPWDIAVDAADSVYVLDLRHRTLRKIGGSTITKVADLPPFNYPSGFALGPSGAIYFGVSTGIAQILPPGEPRVIAGSLFGARNGASLADGPATTATLWNASKMAVDSRGTIYMVEDEARRVRAIGPDQVIRTIAGGGKLPPVDGLLATEIDISPQGIAFDPAGNLHISDGVRVLRVDFDRRITVVAGSGATFCPDDAGRASLACISPFDIAFDAAGNLYIADYSADSSRGNSPGGLIRKVLAIPPAFPAGRLPLELTLSSPSGGAAVRATTLVEAAIPGMSFSATVVSDGDWLKVSPGSGNSPRNLEIATNPASLSPRPAPYEGVVIISVPNALPPARLIRVSLQVGNPLPSQLKVDVPIISFVYPAGASARSESVTISNAGGGNVSFTVRPEEGAGWLTVTPGSGVARPGQPVELSLMADPSGLRGTRRAHLIVEGESGERIEVPIIMAISRLGKAFVLTQKALSFRAIEGGGIIPPQTFGVASLGVEPIAWAVQTKYQNGAGWLKAAAVRTVSTRTETVPEVTVEVDPSGLKPGTYFAVIEVRGASAGVVNSPQALPIFLEVMPATSTLPSAVEPGELTFTAIRGVPPSSKDVFVYNVGSDIRSVSIRASADSAENWLANLPADAVLDKTRRMRVIVQPQFVNAAGKFQGHLTLRFSDGNVREVPVTLIVEEPPATTGRNATASCTPNELVTAVRVQGGTLSVAPGDWVTMEAAVSDNCNQPLIDGVVQLTFANGDPPQPLISMGDGRWQGGWRPSSTLSGFVVEGRSHNGIRGRRDVSLRLLGRVEKPSFTKESIVSLESQRPGDPVAPGSIIVIRGEGLAEKSEEKLPTDWTTDAVGGTRVILGDKPMAMWRASSTELAGQVPFDIAPDAPWTIYVTKGLVLSSAVRVDVAAAWPVITAQLENSGDNFVLRCTGLGPAEAGEDSKTRYAVTVKVDGQPVGQVTATYAKHSYQVAFQLPPGVNGGTAIVSVDTGDQVLSSDPFPLQTRPE